MVVAAGSVLALAVAVNQYLDYIAMGGLALLAIAVGFIIWQLWLHRKAVEQTVETTEIAKMKLPAPARKQVFGLAQEPGYAYSIQDPSTEKIVAKIRSNMKSKWDHTIEDDPSLEELREYEREEQDQMEAVSRRVQSKLRSRRARR